MHSPFSLFLKPLKSLIAYEEILRLFRAKCNLQFPYRQSPRSDYGLSIAHRNPEFYIINGAISLRKVYSRAHFQENCIYLSTIHGFCSSPEPFSGPGRVDPGLKRPVFQQIRISVSIPSAGFFGMYPSRTARRRTECMIPWIIAMLLTLNSRDWHRRPVFLSRIFTPEATILI